MPHPIDKLKSMMPLTESEEQMLLDYTEEHSYKRGDVLDNRNTIRNSIMFVTSGMARTYYMVNDTDHTFSFAFEDEFISIPAVLFESEETPRACIEFPEPTKVLALPRRIISETFSTSDAARRLDVAGFAANALFAQIKILEERLIVLQTLGARQRYEWLLRRYPRILERATATQVASYLGMTKETLYRIRSDRYNKH